MPPGAAGQGGSSAEATEVVLSSRARGYHEIPAALSSRARGYREIPAENTQTPRIIRDELNIIYLIHTHSSTTNQGYKHDTDSMFI